MTELSTLSLPTLAEMANDAAAACEQSARRTVQQAATCGRALLAAREQVPHGEWMVWVRTNFSHHHSVATRYMQVANYADSHNLDDAASVENVLRLIADERAAERAAANPEPAWQEPADMPPPEPPAAPKTIVDHKATQTPAGQPKAPQKPTQAAQQPAGPIKPEIVQSLPVRALGRQHRLIVGRLYRFTREGFDEVDE